MNVTLTFKFPDYSDLKVKTQINLPTGLLKKTF